VAVLDTASLPRRDAGVLAYTTEVFARCFASLCLVFSSACSGSPSDAASPLAPRCGGGEPTFEGAVPALATPLTRVALRVEVPTEVVEAALADAVPWVLAKAEGRSLGAAGKVTYKVKRGPLQVSAADDELVVETRLVADIDVCKPLGPVCLHYGSCQPQWVARVTVPMDWSLNEPPSPKLALSIDKGCVLRPVGYDATPELRRITEDQARNARGQIQRSIAQEYEALHAGLRRAREGLRFGKGPDECLRFEPVSLERTRLRPDESVIGIGVAFTARTEWGCASLPVREPYEGGGPVWPDTKVVEQLNPASEIVVAQDTNYSALVLALTQADKKASVASGLLDGAPRMFAGVSGTSKCDPEWLAVEPAVSEDGLVLRPLGVPLAESETARFISMNARVSLAVSPTRLDAELRELETTWRARVDSELAARGLRLEGEIDGTTAAELGPEAVRSTLSYTGTLSVRSAKPGKVQNPAVP
jgi:hypothetical protein